MELWLLLRGTLEPSWQSMAAVLSWLGFVFSSGAFVLASGPCDVGRHDVWCSDPGTAEAMI
jgi:hypothetical protein